GVKLPKKLWRAFIPVGADVDDPELSVRHDARQVSCQLRGLWRVVVEADACRPACAKAHILREALESRRNCQVTVVAQEVVHVERAIKEPLHRLMHGEVRRYVHNFRHRASYGEDELRTAHLDVFRRVARNEIYPK